MRVKSYNICLRTHKLVIEVQVAYDLGLPSVDAVFDAMIGHEIGDRFHQDKSSDVEAALLDILDDADETSPVAAFGIRKTLHQFDPLRYADPPDNVPDPDPARGMGLLRLAKQLEDSLRDIHN